MKKNFNHFISMFVLIIFLIMAWACDEVSYPAPDPWPQECKFFTPFTAEYETLFKISNSETRAAIPNALVTCKVIKFVRLPHPWIQDSCYWSESIVTTLSGITDAKGELVQYFNITYGSVGDYFILEISAEKDGYYRSLTSEDNRYFVHEKEWVKGYENFPPNKRRLHDILLSIKSINLNP